MTVVDHSRDHDLTVQGNQAARSRALTHLLELPGMPTVSTWLIDATTDRIVGVILAEDGESPAGQQQKIAAWAAFLHLPVTEDTHPSSTTLLVEGLCEYGVAVRIFTQFPAAEQEAAA